MYRTVCLMVVVLTGLAWPLHADVIFLVNGDRLTGKITHLLDNKLTFISDLAGEVTINMENIRSFATDMPVVLHLKDGSVIKHRVSASEAGTIQVEAGAILQTQVVQLADVVKINPPRPKWTGSASAGYTMNRGNSDKDTVNLATDLRRRTEKDRITFGAMYLFSREKNKDTDEFITSQNEWFAQFQYDYFFKPKFYTYVKSRVEQDRVADLDLRLFAGLGVGYQWFESPSFNFATQAGVGWRFEAFPNQDNSSEAAAELGYHIDKSIGEHVTLFHDLTLYPSFQDPSDIFLTTQAGGRVLLSKVLFTETRIIVDYDSTPAEGAETTDFKWIFGIGAKF